MAFVMVFFANSTFAQTSTIGTCSDFEAGPAAWPHVLVATTTADGAASQAAQTFTMNVTQLPASGANVRVNKTTANGNWFQSPASALILGSNSITVPAVTFDRAVKFQFSSGDVEFDELSLNGVPSNCVAVITTVPGCTDVAADNYDANATVDDGSCVYTGCPDQLVTSGSWWNTPSNISLAGSDIIYMEVTMQNNSGQDLDLLINDFQFWTTPNVLTGVNYTVTHPNFVPSGGQFTLTIQIDWSLSLIHI